MQSPMFISQQSCDLSIYLPRDLNKQEALEYQSADALIHKIEFTTLLSSHRMETEVFDPINNDNQAVSTLMHNTFIPTEVFDFNETSLDSYHYDRSQVVPHQLDFSNKSIYIDDQPSSSPSSPSKDLRKHHRRNTSSPNSSQHQNSTHIKRFLVYDDLTGRLRRPLLFEFIRLLLEYEDYSHIARYVDRKQGIFKLEQPDDVAELWKQVKGRNSDNDMTYDKLARALRYYYGNHIMHPSPGRFTFRFGSKSGFGVSWCPSAKIKHEL